MALSSIRFKKMLRFLSRKPSRLFFWVRSSEIFWKASRYFESAKWDQWTRNIFSRKNVLFELWQSSVVIFPQQIITMMILLIFYDKYQHLLCWLRREVMRQFGMGDSEATKTNILNCLLEAHLWKDSSLLLWNVWFFWKMFFDQKTLSVHFEDKIAVENSISAL